MSDEWQNGYKAGYEAGYEAASSGLKKETKPIKIHDPGDIDEIYEQAYGHAIYRKMKNDHNKF